MNTKNFLLALISLSLCFFLLPSSPVSLAQDEATEEEEEEMPELTDEDISSIQGVCSKFISMFVKDDSRGLRDVTPSRGELTTLIGDNSSEKLRPRFLKDASNFYHSVFPTMKSWSSIRFDSVVPGELEAIEVDQAKIFQDVVSGIVSTAREESMKVKDLKIICKLTEQVSIIITIKEVTKFGSTWKITRF